ncbi:MAG: GGDEF domain-containing protein [Elusimicrobiota bacterium]
MINITDYQKTIPKPAALAIGICIVAFFGLADYLTGSELSFSIFYLIPISLVTILAGLFYGIIIAVISAAAWLTADLLPGANYTHALIPYWNAVVRLGYFILHAYLLSKLIEILSKAQDLSLRDSLTGAPNWRYLKEISSNKLQEAHRERRPITVGYIDLDNFKGVNDTMGHDVGDDLLRVIAEIIQTGIRPNDAMARVGGDEFVILLTEIDYDNANKTLVRIKDHISKEMDDNGWPVTISIGAITYRVIPSSIDNMIKKADELMYSVKREGKNSIKHTHWPAQTGD